MTRRRAAWASLVTVSASSRMIILKGGLGYFFVVDGGLRLFSESAVSISMAFVSSSSFLGFPRVKKFLEDFLDLALFPLLWTLISLLLVPMAKLAKCLILSLTTLMPRSSLAFSSRTRRRSWLGSKSSRQRARATDVFPDIGKRR